MSGDTVSGNALQFTNDNKHAYALSGVVDTAGQNVEVNMLKFNTQSEYVKTIMTFSNGSGSGDDVRYYVYFNNVIVAQQYSTGGTGEIIDRPLHIIVPPFTNVRISVTNLSSSNARANTAIVMGEAFMTNRVGNLVE